ncbi:MAG: DUF5615 family PIN-like protein [Phycisphaerae bacterium]|nr:DUF5615 family PIN-like protein [Phycisphaerae bacterium]
MKLLLDEHFSRKLVQMVEAHFPGTTHVALAGLERASDDDLWKFAAGAGFVIVTKDEDFQVMSCLRGPPPKVVWVRTGNGPTEEVARLLVQARGVLESFVAAADRSLLVLP